MKFYRVKEKLVPLKIFSLNDIYLVDESFRQNTLYEWEAEGRVVKVRRGWYTFPEFTPKDSEFYYISNKIYFPSYISLELGLNHYSIIPEAVQQITAVTTRKTQSFSTPIGDFSYRSIKTPLYFGYRILKDNYKVADLEKCILDYIYFNPQLKSEEDLEGMRFSKEILRDKLNIPKLFDYLSVYNSKRMNHQIKILTNYLN